MIKFAVKAGLAATAVYYIKEQGIFKNSDEAIASAQRLKTAVNPYISEIKSQIPVELPEVPHTENVGQLAKEYWNCGVRATFAFLIKLPDYTKEYASKGAESLMENQEIRNFIESFTSEKPVAK
ncbi:MICOS complex subunit MIC13 homolog QIL1 isoform X2 [Anthonomus grandis grandis]|uniref:MICOS complex subunit MIC13 homolog QIL1 isoform X2 n=1 Tax=Anthonomus grandis grandis TaxID=2921223 RepID=UPI002165EC50|nr:MICOS complex subunit MIC13 homolog QIL1 isoform X2 [Anthonomus grandis grandis]